VNDDTLDPHDWDDFRRTLHAAVDAVVDDVAGVRRRPAWRPIPRTVKNALQEPLPRRGEPLAVTLQRFNELVRAYPTGNAHPRFLGWVHGAGTPAGILAELLAAGMNANVGGREHAAVYVERAVIAWFRELFGWPETTSGIVTTGTSMGNLLALVAARDAALGTGSAERGIAGARLVAYASTDVHESVPKALRIAGLGGSALRRIPVDAQHAIDVDALHRRIAKDRAAGVTPFAVVATAGTAGTAAFDPLARLADLCRAEGLWLHVDGAFGALAIASPRYAYLVAGIERADSLAFDAHKWLHVPYGAGAVLFRDEAAHRRAFAAAAPYLQRAPRGTAAGAPWYADYGLELSREFRALKVWFTLRHFGIDRLGAAIGRCCDLAHRFARDVAAAGDLELLAPVTLNVVCFRAVRRGLDSTALDALNAEIAIAIQESGEAVLSSTRVDGRLALRACFINHRTRSDDVAVVLRAVRAAARAVTAHPKSA
jgi:aromatic-L-amino-acid decarboxylase